MLRAEELGERDDTPQDTVVEVAADPEKAEVGPQSPTPYARPAPSSPHHIGVSSQKRKLQLNMPKKIKVVPDFRKGQLNTTYLATLPGLLKIAEIILSFVAFVLAICSDRNSTTAAWTEHICFASCVIVSALLLGYVCLPSLTIKDDATREGLIAAELLFYAAYTLLYFVAIWLMVHLSVSWMTVGRGSAVIDALLCAALTILFAVETILKARAWKGDSQAPSTSAASRAAEQARHYPEVELRRDQGPDVSLE